jgi:hypothetical protein
MRAGRRTTSGGIAARRRSERGQAFTETMVVSWMLLIFLAAMWQLFIVNDTIFRSITAAHSVMFKKAFDRSDKDSGWKTDYSTDAAVVTWARPDLPEAEFPIISMFRTIVGRDSVKMRSNVTADHRKKTIMGSGTAGPDGVGGTGKYFAHMFEIMSDVFSADFFESYTRRLGF